VASIFIPQAYRSTVRDLMSGGTASLLGLLVAWQLFPVLAGPLFSLVLRVLHPDVRDG
jgi:hypothetical protein